MEGAGDVAVIPVDIGWSDVGSWAALLDILSEDEAGNVVRGRHVGIDTQGTLVFGADRLVATIGLRDMIVVDTEDVVLICPADRAQDVKKIVDKLQESGEGYL
jgi:mannose-1-phosphate guanylyltransferase